jgi:5-methyltetrahydrofolate--homocysteine methyltransferase
MNRIDEKQREVALDLVYDRRREGYDPLQELMGMFEGVSAASSRVPRAEVARLPLLERLRSASSTANARPGRRPRRGDDPKPPLAIISEEPTGRHEDRR